MDDIGKVGMAIGIRRVDGPIGAEIVGVDLSKPVDEGTFAAIDATFAERSVIVFRNQTIDERQHVAFSRRFGELEIHVMRQYLLDGVPEILLVSNVQENGRPIGLVDAGQYWHTDLCYEVIPSRCSLLYAREVPVREDGTTLGDTMFTSAVAAYDGLPDAMKRRIAGLRALHRYGDRYDAMRSAGSMRDELTAEQRARLTGAVHPVVRTHPQTGRKAIYVNEGLTVRILDLPEDESRDLLAELCAHIIRPEYRYVHKWQVGDLLMWDNCAVQHCAVADYAPPLRRLMHRTTVKGSVPF
jgi:taurine dioxygenase